MTAAHPGMMRLPHLSKLRRLGRRLADVVPLTWRGFLVALAAGLALWWLGFGTLDLMLFVIGTAGLVLVLLSCAAVGGAALYLRRQLRRPTGDGGQPTVGRLEAGSPIRTGFRLPALGWLPLVRIDWRWLVPDGVECRVRYRDGMLLEEVVAENRCQVTSIRRRFTVQGAFGLTRVAWEHGEPTPLTVLPDVGALRRMPIVQSLAAAEGLPHPVGEPEGDRMEIRRYVPGDSVRNILWKTYARTRQLNVRTPERSVERARKTVAYLLAGPDDEAAAAAARVALETGIFGLDWLFGADGTREPAATLEPALAAIARSRGAGATNGDGHGGGLATFLASPDVRGEVHCIVFAPAHPGSWTAGALAASRGFPGAVSFVLGTDGLVRRRQTPLWRRLLFTEEPAAGTTNEELALLLGTVSSAGCSAQVVDRATGRAYGQSGQRLGNLQ